MFDTTGRRYLDTVGNVPHGKSADREESGGKIRRALREQHIHTSLAQHQLGGGRALLLRSLLWNAKVVKNRAAYFGVLRRVFECSSER